MICLLEFIKKHLQLVEQRWRDWNVHSSNEELSNMFDHDWDDYPSDELFSSEELFTSEEILARDEPYLFQDQYDDYPYSTYDSYESYDNFTDDDDDGDNDYYDDYYDYDNPYAS